jgi:peptidoglycan/LPS O-acetylase OafA/YrhL
MVTRREFKKLWLPYLIEMSVAFAAYAILLTLSIFALHALPGGSPWRIPVAVMPMVPAAGVAVAVARVYRRLDEYARRLLLEALAFAFAGTALITFTYGFLENAGFPRLSWFFVWPVMGVLWIVAGLWQQWRSR